MSKVLGRYELVGLLGQGGMGKVHLGFDKALERYVAIKQITANVLEHPENATLLAYFEREARVVASLQHPNIIQIYEYSAPPGQAAWIVTEFVDGITFEELSEDLGRLPPAAALALLHSVAEALEFAHNRGIIHRDLKPGNVMLSRHGRVFLMDFGLAKSVDGSGLKSMIIGSPAFMAPEQVEGEGTDMLSDVFSFGLLAYALASGQLFFSATAAKAFAEILSHQAPSPEKLEPIQDPALQELVVGCVQRDPAKRIQTMTEVVSRIEEALEGHGVASPGREVRAWTVRWMDLMPQQFSLGPGTTSSQDTTPAAPPQFAPSMPALELPSGFRGRDPDRPGPVIEFGEEMDASEVVSDPGLPAQLPVADEGEPTIEEALPQFAAPPEPPPPGVEELMAALATCSSPPDAARLALLVAAMGGEAPFAELGRLYQEISPGSALDAIAALLVGLVQATVLEQRGEDALGFANPLWEAAIWPALGEDDAAAAVLPPIVARIANRATDALDSFDVARARELLHEAADLCRRTTRLPVDMVYDVLLRRAQVATEEHDQPLARELYEEVLARARDGSESARRAREGLAMAYLREGRLKRAERWIDAGLGSASDAVESAPFRRLRGLIALRRGQLVAARENLEAAINGWPHGSRDRALVLLDLGQVWRVLGKVKEADEAYRFALRTLDDRGDLASSSRARVLAAELLLARGKLGPAEELLDGARGDARAAGARDVHASVLRHRAELLVQRGATEEAVTVARRALAEAEAIREPRPVALTRAGLALVLSVQGEVEQAEHLGSEAWRSMDGDVLGRIAIAASVARVTCLSGDRAAAERVLQEALELADPRAVPVPGVRLAASALAQAAGRSEEASVARERAAREYAQLDAADRHALDLRDLAAWGL